jgi:hypothetical protein
MGVDSASDTGRIRTTQPKSVPEPETESEQEQESENEFELLLDTRCDKLDQRIDAACKKSAGEVQIARSFRLDLTKRLSRNGNGTGENADPD